MNDVCILLHGIEADPNYSDFPHDVGCPWYNPGPCHCGTKMVGEWPSQLERLRMYYCQWKQRFNDGVGVGIDFPPEALNTVEWSIKELSKRIND